VARHPPAKNETALQDAFNIDALKRCEIIISARAATTPRGVSQAARSGLERPLDRRLHPAHEDDVILDPVNMPVIKNALAKGGKNWIGGNCTVSAAC
jgi:aspartate-semialdehyde dehydrogenase